MTGGHGAVCLAAGFHNRRTGQAPHNCGVVSWNGTMYINCIRNIREAELEMRFYQVLKSLGIHIKVESNMR